MRLGAFRNFRLILYAKSDIIVGRGKSKAFEGATNTNKGICVKLSAVV